ncbi:AGE family epimerase/isomerase [Sagittula sp. S175]|uniref:AGE family epimerase/isomerase n=1 Tax=Sagittula sp. S175 TaxID=3415129 RepID=UPI003C7C4F52
MNLLTDSSHREFLLDEARRSLRFFDASLRADGGFDVLDWQGAPLPRGPQELHTTTRMVHSYVLGRAIGHPNADRMIDAGLAYLWNHHRDQSHGGYLWAVGGDDSKLAYGHVFVLLAASSAKLAGHPDADRLLADISDILDRHFWEEDHGLYADEFTRDWQPFSGYRGMNANMHGVEAMLAAFEATGDAHWLSRAGRVLDFFTARMAPAHNWRLPEHYTADWQVDPAYSGNPMFRPAGTTPGHSFELARLCLHHWDLLGRPATDAPTRARAIIERAMADGWRADGGILYTLATSGQPAIRDRYWWPVTEAIGVYAHLLKLSPTEEDRQAYDQLWTFAQTHFIDADNGGWFPEIDDTGQPTTTQFHGKPDIYHALQADLYPLTPGLSRPIEGLANLTT